MYSSNRRKSLTVKMGVRFIHQQLEVLDGGALDHHDQDRKPARGDHDSLLRCRKATQQPADAGVGGAESAPLVRRSRRHTDGGDKALLDTPVVKGNPPHGEVLLEGGEVQGVEGNKLSRTEREGTRCTSAEELARNNTTRAKKTYPAGYCSESRDRRYSSR